MPKLKTNKAAKKRYSLTATGNEISKGWNFKRISFWTDRGDPGKTKEGWFHHQYGMQ